MIAREYGFASWPRLVRYFGDVERQMGGVRVGSSGLPPRAYEAMARSLLAGHRHRRASAGRAFAAYVPRFYGKSLDEVFAAEVTEAEARLATARMYGLPGWEALRKRAAADHALHQSREWEVDPFRLAIDAIAATDVEALRRVVQAHPELLHPSDEEEAVGRTLLNVVIGHEQRLGVAAMRPITEWLAAQGLDLQRALNQLLCGYIFTTAENVRWLLERDADPNWLAPNGVPVLEHALIRYWDGEAVDALAARAKPRRALWIAAGLGEVEGVSRFLDARGRPTRAARRLRPDFVAAGRGMVPPHPDPDDEEILLEAFSVAMWNGRTAVLDYMVSRGFNVNTLAWETPVLNLAVGNGWAPVVECLLRLGADPELKGRHPDMSAREIARELFEQDPRIAERRRIVELLDMDPEAILAGRDARPVAPPGMSQRLQEVLELAGDDAFRLGQSGIRTENLLFGLLRGDEMASVYFARKSGLDRDRFRAEMQDRPRPADERVERPKLPIHTDAEEVIQAATATAIERRHDAVHGLHLLYALTRAGRGAAAELLERYGGSAETLNRELAKAL